MSSDRRDDAEWEDEIELGRGAERLEEELKRVRRLNALVLLTGAIAEELNNLLAAIRVYAEVVPDKQPSLATAPAVREIRNSCDIAFSLVRRLQAFTRWPDSAVERIDVQRVIAETAPLLRTILGVNVKLDLSLTALNRVVTLEDGALEQMLVVFIANARDALVCGGTVTIRTRNVVRPDRRPSPEASAEFVRIEVEDTGIGMTPELAARVFEPFFTTKANAAGLGLATVQDIVNATGGFVEVESTSGYGSRFRVYLPVA
jgi:two-component system cell cycle sensor histidine kinase/response regulator CckA